MRHRDLYDDLTDGEVPEDMARESAKGIERRENERIWAHYRARDITQREAAELVIRDRQKVPTQSQVSRIYRGVERDILYNSAILGGYQDEVKDDHTNNPITGFGPDYADIYPEAVIELLKDIVAEWILRRRALLAIKDIENEPEAWMYDYLPDAAEDIDLLEHRVFKYVEGPFEGELEPAEDIKRVVDEDEPPEGADA